MTERMPPRTGSPDGLSCPESFHIWKLWLPEPPLHVPHYLPALTGKGSCPDRLHWGSHPPTTGPQPRAPGEKQCFLDVSHGLRTEPNRRGILPLLHNPSVCGGRARIKDPFLLVPLLSHGLHAGSLGKLLPGPSEGLKGPFMALLDFLGPRRSVGRKFPKGQRGVLFQRTVGNSP